jgi:hypothetical protein
MIVHWFIYTRNPKVVTSIVGKKDDLLFKSVPEDKGLDDLVEDEYARYDSVFDSNADQYLVSWVFVNSRLLLSD